MLTSSSYRRFYRLSAWYDLLVTWALATPPTLALLWQGFDRLHGAFGLPQLPELSVYAILFANFLGSVVIVWSLVRLHLDDPRLGRYDAVARYLFSAWMIVALLNGASPVLWAFLIVEISFGVAQSLPVRVIAGATEGHGEGSVSVPPAASR